MNENNAWLTEAALMDLEKQVQRDIPRFGPNVHIGVRAGLLREMLSKLRAPVADERAAVDPCGYVAVKSSAVDWLKDKFPALTIKAGLCERIGGQLYTITRLMRDHDAALASAPVAGEAQPFAVLAVHKNGEIRSYSTGQALADAPIQDHERELQRKYGYELVTVYAAPQASEAVRDAAFEAVRKQLCKLPRYSFFAGAALGSVRRVEDRSGNWIEFDAAHALFDPVAVDAALSAQPGAQRTGCTCATCRPHSVEMRMILCSICSDKRCPHAADHRNECSNQPKQHNDGGADAI